MSAGRILYLLASGVFLIPFCIMSVIVCLFARRPVLDGKVARIVWGPIPIINNKYWSKALKDNGYNSTTYMHKAFENINTKDDFDEYVSGRLKGVPAPIKLVLLFWESLLRFDVFCISCNGWLLGHTPYGFLEAPIFKFAAKKTIVIPFGGDAYVYKNVRSVALRHGLQLSYPALAKDQETIEKRVAYWRKHADFMPGSVISVDGIGRWDALLFNYLFIDTEQWQASKRNSNADGRKDTVYVTHAPNHTGFKGTEFVKKAVEDLQTEGLKVELKLLQNIQNEEVRRILAEDTDILVEQLIFTGHGLNGLEGMASGLPVVCNLEDENYTKIFRRWSYLDECPLVSAEPENITDVLRALVTRPALRAELAQKSREYAEKYNDLSACHFLFSNALDFIYGHKPHNEMMNLYHPLMGEFPKDKPYIDVPLDNNRIKPEGLAPVKPAATKSSAATKSKTAKSKTKKNAA